MLNASENVIVMVDVAHRTQYGILGGRMSKALPNAVMVGFTGTPIEKDFKRSTIGASVPSSMPTPFRSRWPTARRCPSGTKPGCPNWPLRGGDPGQAVRGHVGDKPQRSRPRFAAATPTRRRSPRRRGVS